MSNYGIRNIFLADDNPEVCLIFEKAIIQIDVHLKFTTVTNGEELLQLLTHYIPDILFLDLAMPYKNGIQCLQTINGLYFTNNQYEPFRY